MARKNNSNDFFSWHSFKVSSFFQIHLIWLIVSLEQLLFSLINFSKKKSTTCWHWRQHEAVSIQNQDLFQLQFDKKSMKLSLEGIVTLFHRSNSIKWFFRPVLLCFDMCIAGVSTIQNHHDRFRPYSRDSSGGCDLICMRTSRFETRRQEKFISKDKLSHVSLEKKHSEQQIIVNRRVSTIQNHHDRFRPYSRDSSGGCDWGWV